MEKEGYCNFLNPDLDQTLLTIRMESFLIKCRHIYISFNPSKKHSDSSDMKFLHFLMWRPILGCMDPDPLTQLNPDPKHCFKKKRNFGEYPPFSWLIQIYYFLIGDMDNRFLGDYRDS